MSHMTLEYSGNLREAGQFRNLCCKLAQFMVDLELEGRPIFPPGGVRVRAIPCDEYCIADDSIKNAGFVHATLKIGAGRTAAAKQAAVTGLFDIMKEHFDAHYLRQGLALSLELAEFSESGTLKHNNLHARLKKP